jgi:hypothetical protein
VPLNIKSEQPEEDARENSSATSAMTSEILDAYSQTGETKIEAHTTQAQSSYLHKVILFTASQHKSNKGLPDGD